jgi:hypothetical protein
MHGFDPIDSDMIAREICCAEPDVVYVKSIATAYDGLCCLFSEGGGQIVLAAPRGREAELDRLVDDIVEEFVQTGRSITVPSRMR